MNRSVGKYQACTICKWLTHDVYDAFVINILWYWSQVTCGQRTCKVITIIKRIPQMLFVRITLSMCNSASPAWAYRKRNQTDILKVISDISGAESMMKWCYFHRHKKYFFLAYIEILYIRTEVRSMFDNKFKHSFMKRT